MVNQPHELKQKTQKVMFAVAKLNKHWAKQQTIKDEISTVQYSCKLNQKHIHIKKNNLPQASGRQNETQDKWKTSYFNNLTR